MESVEAQVLRLLEESLAHGIIRESTLGSHSDMVIRAGDTLLAVQVKTSIRPSTPFDITEVDHVISEARSVERNAGILLPGAAVQPVVITNMSLSSDVLSLLKDSNIQVFSCRKDAAAVVKELKQYVEQLKSQSREKPQDRWTQEDLEFVNRADTQEEFFRRFGRLSGIPTTDNFEQLMASIQSSQFDGPPEDVEILYLKLKRKLIVMQLGLKYRKLVALNVDQAAVVRKLVDLLRVAVNGPNIERGYAKRVIEQLGHQEQRARYVEEELAHLPSTPDEKSMSHVQELCATLDEVIKALDEIQSDIVLTLDQKEQA